MEHLNIDELKKKAERKNYKEISKNIEEITLSMRHSYNSTNLERESKDLSKDPYAYEFEDFCDMILGTRENFLIKTVE